MLYVALVLLKRTRMTPVSKSLLLELDNFNKARFQTKPLKSLNADSPWDVSVKESKCEA